MPTVLIFGLLLVLICLLAWLSRDRAPTLEESGVTLAKGQMPHLFVILCGLVVMAGFLAESASEGWSALHLERTLGGSAGEGALGPALLGLTMGFGRLFGHVLVGWMRDTTLILLATLVSAAGIALAGVATSIPMALLGFSLGAWAFPSWHRLRCRWSAASCHHRRDWPRSAAPRCWATARSFSDRR
ncbi:hypothetical protein [Sulfitobacter aestuariivivens]|uniref:hypothetical protein n=1 Tax=Sulfitobacter aestuariivivens TaxID=2766981 RepID=UPI0036183F0E